MKYKGNIIFISLIILAAISVSLSYYWNIQIAENKTNDIVKQQSNAFFSEIVTTRQWNAGYGGVYVPVTDEIQPNKYLDIPDRDVYTTDSVLLTKINPAFMTRLVSEIAAKKEGIKYHITSLKLTNPNNKADEWETQSLEKFAEGDKENFKYFKKDSTYRYMAPLMVTNACMKCHEKDGYKVGDVRGGISVTTPGNILIKLLAEEKMSILIAHALIFILFLIFLILLWVLNFKQFKKIRDNNNLLKTQSDELLLQQEATEKLNQEIFAKSLEVEQARQELENSVEQIRSQAALSEILKNISGTERSLNTFLQDALNILLALPWLKVMSKGSIFLTDTDGNLRMIAEKDLGEVADRCALIKPGECLCGKALSEKKMQFCNHIDHKHDITFENMQEHGHYNFPLIMNDKVLGVLNIYTDHKHESSDFEVDFLQTVSSTLASVINRKQEQNELKKIKEDLEEKNKHIRKYLVQLEQQGAERESLNQMILAQKKQVEEKNKQVQIQRDEVEQYAKQLEEQSLEQEKLNQQLFAQKLEVEQRNMEVQQYAKQLEEQAKEQEKLNQELFAQKLEVEQRNSEVELYTKQLEEQAKEQEKLNQKVFAQKLEVEQRNFEVEQYSKQLEGQALEQEKLNQKIFAQKLEVEQRNFEVEQYSKQLEEQAKEQENLNQELFAQKLEVETLKEKAEGTLKHLNDSINYSKYIQDSLLPLDSFMEENIPGEYFVYFKPKETIGGDFYYANKVGDYLILAVADCTGHGVPGALITMLGITFLNDIIDRKLAKKTGEALNVLRKRIKTTFRSYGDNLQNKNGLDISLCAINLKTNVMQYSGAFNSLFIFRNNELIEYKATRNPIGYYPVEKDFETTEIKLQNDDVIYLFSDGYPDQVGGPKNRKFSKRQFKDFLQEIHKFPITKQSVFADKIMQKWMGNSSQVDDITLMGIKWNNYII